MRSPLRDKRLLAFAGVALVAEYFAISLAFDAQLVAGRGGAWEVLGQVGQIGPLIIVGVTAFFLSAPWTKKAPGEGLSPALNGGWLALHALSYCGFFAATAFAFGQAVPPGPALAWLVGWCVAGLVTVGTLALAVLPQFSIIRRLLGQLLVAGGALGFVAWGGGLLMGAAWPYLARATFITVASILSATPFELLVDHARLIMELEGFVITIAPVCSGVEGMGLFLVLMGAFLYRLRAELRFPLALVLLPVGMLSIWFGNALRIAALMVVGARVDPELALGSFHSKAGWLFFCAITLVVALVGQKLLRRDEDPSHDAPSLAGAAEPFLVPLIAWIAVGMTTSAFAQGHDPLYGARVLVVLGVLFAYRSSYAALRSCPSLVAISVGALVGALWVVFVELWGGATESEGARGLSPLWVVLRVFGAVVLVPLVEELAFRGFLARRLSAANFAPLPYREMTVFGVVGSSLAFGALHQQWHLAAITGVLYALLVKKTGRFSDAVFAHGASNAVIALWVLVTGSFQHW